MSSRIKVVQQSDGTPLERNESNSTQDDDLPITLLQSLFGATAIVTATLFYVSWIYNRRYFEVFGLNGSSIRYTTQDYILNAKSVLAVTLFGGFLLFLVAIHPVSRSRVFRIFVFLVSVLGLVAVLVYVVTRVGSDLSLAASSTVIYRTVYAALFGVITLLAYGAIAPTILWNKASKSVKYRRYSHFLTLSALGVLMILAASLAANTLGSVEGRLDASLNSRLLSINIATDEPLGFGVPPNSILTAADGSSIFVYYNLRFLTQFEGLLYVFRPQAGVVYPLVHVLPISKARVLSLGPNPANAEPVFASP